VLSLSAAGRLLILRAADHHSLNWSLVDAVWKWLLFPLASCSWTSSLVVYVWISVFIWRCDLILTPDTCCFPFLKHRGTHSLFSLFTGGWGVYHFLRLEQNIINASCRVVWHTPWHSVGDVVRVHWHLSRVDKLVLPDNTHICRYSTHLFASHVVIELCGGITWSGSVLNTLIRSDWVVSKCCDLLVSSWLVARKFALVLSASTLALTATVV